MTKYRKNYENSMFSFFVFFVFFFYQGAGLAWDCPRTGGRAQNWPGTGPGLACDWPGAGFGLAQDWPGTGNGLGWFARWLAGSLAGLPAGLLVKKSLPGLPFWGRVLPSDDLFSFRGSASLPGGNQVDGLPPVPSLPKPENRPINKITDAPKKKEEPTMETNTTNARGNIEGHARKNTRGREITPHHISKINKGKTRKTYHHGQHRVADPIFLSRKMLGNNISENHILLSRKMLGKSRKSIFPKNCTFPFFSTSFFEFRFHSEN